MIWTILRCLKESVIETSFAQITANVITSCRNTNRVSKLLRNQVQSCHEVTWAMAKPTFWLCSYRAVINLDVESKLLSHVFFLQIWDISVSDMWLWVLELSGKVRYIVNKAVIPGCPRTAWAVANILFFYGVRFTPQLLETLREQKQEQLVSSFRIIKWVTVARHLNKWRKNFLMALGTYMKQSKRIK